MKHSQRLIPVAFAMGLFTQCGNVNAALISGDFSGFVYNSFSNDISLGQRFANGKRVFGTFTINTAAAQVVDRDLNANSARYEDVDLNDNWVDIQWQLQDFDIEGLLTGTASYDALSYTTSQAKDYVSVHDYNLIPSPTGNTSISKSFFVEEYEAAILNGVDVAQSFSWSDPAYGCGDQPNTFVRCAFFNFTQRGGNLTYTYVDAWLDTVNFYGEQPNTTTNASSPTGLMLFMLGLVGIACRRKLARG
ncbi:hypothetical protein [Alteromonas sp. AMM-1]|uniref:hypothetical protein n=1 Tax=Alteromonas sp. AMM-1 TaxID=3394233 RepID=UPI0039A4E15D